MKCEVFEQRLQEVLDERKPPEGDRTLRAHAESCHDCRQVFVAQEALFQGMELFHVPELPLGFAEQVVNGFVRPQRRRRPLLVAAWIAAVAAAVLVALFPLVRGWDAADPRQPAPVADEDPPASVTDPLVDNSTPGDSDVADFSQLSLGDTDLLKETTDFVKSMGADNLASVRPITSSFSSAMTLIRGTLPGGRSDEAKKSDSSLIGRPPIKPVV